MSTSSGMEEEACLSALQLASAAVLPMALRAAIELGILEVMTEASKGDGPTLLTSGDIAARLCARNPDAPALIERLLRLLASYSILTCSATTNTNQSHDGRMHRRYGLGEKSRFLLGDENGGSFGPLLLTVHDKVYMEPWYHLKDSVLEGGIPFYRAYGMNIFYYHGKDPRLNRLFNNGMYHQSTIIMKKILKIYAQGVQHVEGDMFATVPTGDAIFMKSILHDWDDDHCLKLPENCWKALPENGKVIVVEMVLPETVDNRLSTSAVFQRDVLMLVLNHGGKERREKGFEGLAKAAGFTGIKAICCAYNFWVIEFYKSKCTACL